MQSIKEAASTFLANKRVAVTGVSRTPKTHGSNTSTGGCVSVATTSSRSTRTPPRSRATRSYQDLRSIPGGVDAVVIATRPEIAEDTMRAVRRARHQARLDALGRVAGAASRKAATEYGRQNGITVIDGGCPLMFGPTADFGHKVMRVVLAGRVPKQV